jgi:hypothetical protein
MKVNLKGVDLPPSPTLIKWYSAVTLATLSLPVWINETPFHLSDMTKAAVEWGFKGVNVILSILAVLNGLDHNSLMNYASMNQKDTPDEESGTGT